MFSAIADDTDLNTQHPDYYLESKEMERESKGSEPDTARQQTNYVGTPEGLDPSRDYRLVLFRRQSIGLSWCTPPAPAEELAAALAQGAIVGGIPCSPSSPCS